ncbi:GntR family transcriptional regulator [Flexivirga caeni]|uniref:GntR family transcriptional regulator n=1 Tax=Flexivirga caeni TaxID=2294115 RepID=A0A3M9LW80_9MICO|nr:GntR family transcriptional regulator [Flexivirga caeni]RNI17237.1 GntR family transcriptional regulator [Flexivirga caeni]
MATTPRGGASARAYERIRRDIVAGTLAAGTMLSESELAAALGVSRTPIRSALSRLQSEGWVTIYPQRGALVRELTYDEIREAAEVRHALETAGVLRADPAGLEAALQTLEASVEAQRKDLAAGDFAAFNERAQQFHRGFVALAGNATMLALYDRVQDRQLQSTARSAAEILDDPGSVVAEHREMIDDARRGDWAAFAELLDRHQTSRHGTISRMSPPR